MYYPYEPVTDAGRALALLKSGNERYVLNNLSDKADYAAERAALATGQRPLAIVLTCSDSRTAPEIFFDQKLGDLFVVRNAGNIAEPAALGSIEYAAEHLKTPLAVIIGHKKCGAVTAAYQDIETQGNLKVLLEKIKPVCAGCGDEDEAIRRNIRRTAEQIADNEVVRKNGVTVLGAYYDIETGVVSWL